MKVLVTGATGFLGCNLLPILAEEGHEVWATDQRQSRVLEELKFTGHQWLGPDLRSPGAADQLVRGMDAVVHLAAIPGVLASIQSSAQSFGVNVHGTFNILEAARRTLSRDDIPNCKRVIIASTGSAADPTNPYAASKAMAEIYCKAYSASFGLEACALRFTNLYGPWCSEKGSAIATFVRRALANETIQVDGDGTQRRDFLHAEDAARSIAHALLAAEWIGGQTLTVGTGTSHSIGDALSIIEKIHGKDLSLALGPPRSVPEAVINPEPISKTRDLLGWTSKHTLESGIKTVYDWLNTRQDLVETPESVGEGQCELISALDVGKGRMRVDFRDIRGKKRRKEVSKDSIATWQKALIRGKKTAPQSEQHKHDVAIAEATWLLSLFPGD